MLLIQVVQGICLFYIHFLERFSQWHISVVKYGGHLSSGQAIKMFRCLEKLVLPSISDTSLSALMM